MVSKAAYHQRGSEASLGLSLSPAVSMGQQVVGLPPTVGFRALSNEALSIQEHEGGGLY